MFKIKTTGFQQLIDRLEKAPVKVVKEVDAVFDNTAKEFVARAKRDAPKDTGFLTGDIDRRKEKELRYNIFSSSRYAGYQEFGTKTFYTPIPGFEEIAASLKGPGSGSLADMKDNITQWVTRKGILFKGMDIKQTAEVIMISILKKGIKPHPYFFKQVAIAEMQLEKDLKLIAEEIFD